MWEKDRKAKKENVSRNEAHFEDIQSLYRCSTFGFHISLFPEEKAPSFARVAGESSVIDAAVQ